MRKHRGSFFAFLEIPLYADLDGFRGIFFAGYSPVEVQMSIKVYTKFCNVFFQCGVVDEYYWIKILLRKYHYSIGSVLGYKKQSIQK
jgi:hypothetical protein